MVRAMKMALYFIKFYSGLEGEEKKRLVIFFF